MHDLNDMYLFAKVIEHGGYSAASRALGVALEATNRRVNVVDEGFDIAVRVRLPPLEDSDLAVRPLGRSQVFLVCSRWFIAQHGEPSSIDDLEKLPTLSVAQPGGKYVWR